MLPFKTCDIENEHLRPPAPQIAYLGLEVPFELRELVLRHHRHLVALVETLLNSEISPSACKSHVDQLVDAYRTELLAAIASITRENADVRR